MYSDDTRSALRGLERFGKILEPHEVDEPILTPPVRSALIEWMREINHRDKLAEVGLKPRRTAMLFGPPGTGKAQPNTSLVKTLSGWSKLGDLKVGDQIASIDGAPSMVVGVFPQGEREVWRVHFSDGSIVECCAEHLWLLKHKDWHSQRVLETKTIAEKLKRKSNQCRLTVPLVTGDFGHTNELPIDPYLLGALIGDGSLREKESIRFTAADSDVIERIKAALPDEMELRWIDRYDYRIVNKERSGKITSLRDALVRLGLSGLHSYEKFIPDLYKLASKSARLKVLQGILDTDGYAQRCNNVQISTTSEVLARDIVDVVNSLGGIATISPKQPTYTYRGEKRNGRPAWVVHVHHPFGRDLMSLPRHNSKLPEQQGASQARRTIEHVERTGRFEEMSCIKVSHPSETYITNNYVVTHNTTFAHHFAARLGLPLVAIQSEDVISQWVGETGRNLGEVFRLLDQAADKCVVLFDEIDAIAPHRSGSQASDKERSAYLTVMLRRIEQFQGLCLAATNKKENIDSALWRRFDMQVEMGLPGEDERFAILRRYAEPFELTDEDTDLLVDLTYASSPSLLRQLMEGMKRALVLWPVLGRDVGDPVAVFRQITSSISPPPEMEKPPLWDGQKDLRKLAGMTWPPVRKAPEA
jgi:hypothetical protein